MKKVFNIAIFLRMEDCSSDMDAYDAESLLYILLHSDKVDFNYRDLRIIAHDAMDVSRENKKD